MLEKNGTQFAIGPRGIVGWMSDWGKVDELMTDGTLVRIAWHGSGLYGHTEYRLAIGTEFVVTKTDDDWCGTVEVVESIDNIFAVSDVEPIEKHPAHELNDLAKAYAIESGLL